MKNREIWASLGWQEILNLFQLQHIRESPLHFPPLPRPRVTPPSFVLEGFIVLLCGYLRLQSQITFFFIKVPTFPSLAKKKLHFSEKNLVSIINQPVDQSILYVIQLKSFVLREIKENFFFFYGLSLFLFYTSISCLFFFLR